MISCCCSILWVYYSFFLWQCGGVLAWLFVWSEVQTCICSSWCHCHSPSPASVKSRLVLPFWYRLTWVVPEKGPVNGVCAFFCDSVLVTDCGPQKSYKAGFVYNGGIFFYSTSGHYGLQVWLSCVRVLLRICSELIRGLQIVQFTVCADEMFPDCKPFKQLFKQNCGQWWCFASRMFSHLIIFRGNQPYIMKISTLSKLQ